MSAASTGAQWASRRTIPSLIVNLLRIVVAVASILVIVRIRPTAAASDYILMSRSDPLSRPTSGAAWSALGSRRLVDRQPRYPEPGRVRRPDHPCQGPGIRPYGHRFISDLGRHRPEGGGRDGERWADLALGRNSPGYVLAADFIDLGAADPSFDQGTFRPWLRSLLTKTLDGKTLVSTHGVGRITGELTRCRPCRRRRLSR